MNYIMSTALLEKVLLQSGIAMLVLVTSFIILEPVISHAATAAKHFTVRQQITSEISFLVSPSNVTMYGAIGGMTGGTATGTTYAVVRTNSSGGYNLNIKFSNNPAMQGDTTNSTAIHDYTTAGPEPDYNLTASAAARFYYTVNASTTSDLDTSFMDTGSTCGSGAYSANHCWKGPATSDFQVINRSTSADTGATTSFTFVVDVPNNPSPAVDSDYYTATATLTAVTQ